MHVDVIITDLENIIYSSKKYYNNKLCNNLLEHIKNRKSAFINEIKINEEIDLKGNVYLEPIISDSLGIGLVIFYSDKKQEYVEKLCKLVAEMISYHIK